MTKTKTETKRKTIAVSRESDEKSRKKKASAATRKSSAKAKEKTVTDSSVKIKSKTAPPTRTKKKASESSKQKKNSKSRAFFLASILLTVFSVGLMFFQNADLQVYAEEVSQAIASTVGIDTTAPTLNAAVSDGYLQIVAEDTESKVDKLFVCGYEYSGLLNNALSIRLQQFDAGYEQFSIYAVDSAGNISQEYLVPNPYYDPAGGGTGAVDALPIDAAATNATSATGTVTEHSTTPSSSSASTSASRNNTRNNASESSGSGNSTASSSSGSGRSTGNSVGSSSDRTGSPSLAQSEAKRSALEEADAYEDGAIPRENGSASGSANANEGGKEFYTIKTGNDKTFYLVIDRDKNAENVHFLTDISERDLLNTTQDNSATLPRNSASTAGSGGNLLESALPNNNPISFWQNEEQQEAGQIASQNEGSEEKANVENDESTAAVSEEDTEKETDAPGFTLPAGNILRLVLLGGGMFAVAVIVVMIRKKRKGDADEADEDEEDEEIEEGEEDPEEDDEEEAEEGDPEDEDDDDDEG